MIIVNDFEIFLKIKSKITQDNDDRGFIFGFGLRLNDFSDGKSKIIG